MCRNRCGDHARVDGPVRKDLLCCCNSRRWTKHPCSLDGGGIQIADALQDSELCEVPQEFCSPLSATEQGDSRCNVQCLVLPTQPMPGYSLERISSMNPERGEPACRRAR